MDLGRLTASLDANLVGAHGHVIIIPMLEPNRMVAEHYTNFIRLADHTRYPAGQIPSRVTISAQGRVATDRSPSNPTNAALWFQRTNTLDTMLRLNRNPSDTNVLNIYH